MIKKFTEFTRLNETKHLETFDSVYAYKELSKLPKVLDCIPTNNREWEAITDQLEKLKDLIHNPVIGLKNEGTVSSLVTNNKFKRSIFEIINDIKPKNKEYDILMDAGFPVPQVIKYWINRAIKASIEMSVNSDEYTIVLGYRDKAINKKKLKDINNGTYGDKINALYIYHYFNSDTLPLINKNIKVILNDDQLENPKSSSYRDHIKCLDATNYPNWIAGKNFILYRKIDAETIEINYENYESPPMVFKLIKGFIVPCRSSYIKKIIDIKINGGLQYTLEDSNFKKVDCVMKRIK